MTLLVSKKVHDPFFLNDYEIQSEMVLISQLLKTQPRYSILVVLMSVRMGCSLQQTPFVKVKNLRGGGHVLQIVLFQSRFQLE